MAPLPTVDPLATPVPSLPPGELDLSALGWETVVQELDPNTQELIGHWLAVGALDNADPASFEKLVETDWRFDLYATQQPVVDGPAGGQVLYVSDDGTTSEIRMVGIDGSESRLLGVVNDVVYTARLSPDGKAAYLVLLDRDSGRDQGVWRALRNTTSLQRVMPAPVVDLAASGGIRLAATTRFVRTLKVSADGSLVGRLACGEPYGTCVLDLLNVADGHLTHYDPPNQSGDLAAVGDGVILGLDYCVSETQCVTEGMDLSSGKARVFPGRPPVVGGDGHLLVLHFPGPTVVARAFFSSHLDGSGQHLVFVTDGSVRPIYQEGIDFEGVRIELPWGWVAMSLDWPTADGGYRVTPAAVRLTDGGWIGLTLPQIYPIGGGHD